jgi:hypothetical protein
MTDEKIITHELLKSWGPCVDGYERYKELFPDGATLPKAIEGLVADGHDSWGYWLFNAARKAGGFERETGGGYRNAGEHNAGRWNAGNWNAGDCNAGDYNAGDWNAGDYNAGDSNAGDCNVGSGNVGSYNAGDWNAGSWNAGYRNAGDYNAGSYNAGDSNAGDCNVGDYNAGDYNVGYFNSTTPDEIRVFNKPCSRAAWGAAPKPTFIRFDLAYWVPISEMTDAEKAADPGATIRGGQARMRDYKEAWRLAWANASEDDRKKLFALPNFDADVFREITGIDVNAGREVL